MAGGSYGVFSQGFGQIDQGVDFAGRGAIPAVGPGVVTDVTSSTIIETGNTQWPVVIYKLTGGPYRGNYVYVAENFTPQVKVGDHLRQGQSIGNANGSYPYIEVGFNQTSQGWTAYGSPSDRNSVAGTKMRNLIAGQIGASKVTPAPGGAIPSLKDIIAAVESDLAHYKNSDGTYGTNHKTATAIAKFIRSLIPQVHSGQLTTAQADQKIASFAGTPVSVSSPSYLGQAAHDVAAPFESIYSGITSFADAIKFIFSIRGLQTIGGGVLLLMGLYLLVRQVGLAADIPEPPGPIKTAALAAVPESAALKVGQVRERARSTRRAASGSQPTVRRSRTRTVHHYHPTGSPGEASMERRTRRDRLTHNPETAEIPF